jgi:hypothetical protein
LDTPLKGIVAKYIKTLFDADIEALAKDEPVSLLGKWLPSINAHNADTVRYGKIVAKSLGLSEQEYRRALSKLRARIAIIENYLREKDYTFDYSKQPSKAMLKYRNAFYRNDGERYREYLSKVERGEVRMNTGTLLPYEIRRPILNGKLSEDERRGIDITWTSLEDFTNGENAIVVIDGSGSMYGRSVPMPAEIALSLGIYYAERNTGAFWNHFITFSENPRLVEIK